jgi:anaerobic selenocysteine-containing dehydrogenase
VARKNSAASRWPVVRQLAHRDGYALADAAMSERTRELAPRTRSADQVVKSICPYCAVGCGQLVYIKDKKIIDIEGDPDSPISRGCLCPKYGGMDAAFRRRSNIYERRQSLFAHAEGEVGQEF